MCIYICKYNYECTYIFIYIYILIHIYIIIIYRYSLLDIPYVAYSLFHVALAVAAFGCFLAADGAARLAGAGSASARVQYSPIESNRIQ